MNLIEQAYNQLYPNKTHNYTFFVKYSGKFKPYNGNIRLYQNNLTVSFSKNWRKISKDIRIGLAQSLMVKLFKEKKHTTEMDLYTIFMKNVHLAIPKEKVDPILEESFTRINEKFFNNSLEIPNLVWGNDTTRKLGCYEYGSDTITLSSIFKDENPKLMDYVMYHEMLHKKLKFNSKNGRSHYHTSDFRQMEAAFPNSKSIEKELQYLATRKARFKTNNNKNNFLKLGKKFIFRNL